MDPIQDSTAGLRNKKFRDVGGIVTVKTDMGVIKMPSPNKGMIYQIGELTDFAPWNPNMRKATLGIYVNGERIYTYLDERFNDELIRE
jgi:hypothetical protein